MPSIWYDLQNALKESNYKFNNFKEQDRIINNILCESLCAGDDPDDLPGEYEFRRHTTGEYNCIYEEDEYERKREYFKKKLSYWLDIQFLFRNLNEVEIQQNSLSIVNIPTLSLYGAIHYIGKQLWKKKSKSNYIWASFSSSLRHTLDTKYSSEKIALVLAPKEGQCPNVENLLYNYTQFNVKYFLIDKEEDILKCWKLISYLDTEYENKKLNVIEYFKLVCFIKDKYQHVTEHNCADIDENSIKQLLHNNTLYDYIKSIKEVSGLDYLYYKKGLSENECENYAFKQVNEIKNYFNLEYKYIEELKKKNKRNELNNINSFQIVIDEMLKEDRVSNCKKGEMYTNSRFEIDNILKWDSHDARGFGKILLERHPIICKHLIINNDFFNETILNTRDFLDYKKNNSFRTMLNLRKPNYYQKSGYQINSALSNNEWLVHRNNSIYLIVEREDLISIIDKNLSEKELKNELERLYDNKLNF